MPAATPADNPTPKAAPWAPILATDQEILAAELGPEAGATALAVWFRLVLASRGSNTVSVSYGTIAKETRLGLRTIARRVADLTALGFVEVAPVTCAADWTSATRFTLLHGLPPTAISATPGCHNGNSRLPLCQGVNGNPLPTFLLHASYMGEEEETPRPSTGAAPEGPRPQKPRVQFVKPSLEEVVTYCVQEKMTMCAAEFYDHFEANGWKVGKALAPMKDWQAAARGWNRRQGQFSPGARPTTTIKAAAEVYHVPEPEVM